MIIDAKPAREIKLAAEDLLRCDLSREDLSSLIDLALEMLRENAGPAHRRPKMHVSASIAPGIVDHLISSDRNKTLRVWAPLTTPNSREGNPADILDFVIKAATQCLKWHETIKDRDDKKDREGEFADGVLHLADVSTVVMGSGLTPGGADSLVHGPSPFGKPTVSLRDGSKVLHNATFPTAYPSRWTASALPDFFIVDAEIMICGLTYEPDSDETVGAMEMLRETAKLDLNDTLADLRSSMLRR